MCIQLLWFPFIFLMISPFYIPVLLINHGREKLPLNFFQHHLIQSCHNGATRRFHALVKRGGCRWGEDFLQIWEVDVINFEDLQFGLDNQWLYVQIYGYGIAMGMAIRLEHGISVSKIDWKPMALYDLNSLLPFSLEVKLVVKCWLSHLAAGPCYLAMFSCEDSFDRVHVSILRWTNHVLLGRFLALPVLFLAFPDSQCEIQND